MDKEIRDLRDKIKCKLNELINLRKENTCYKGFITNEKLVEKYNRFREEFYRNREWKN